MPGKRPAGQRETTFLAPGAAPERSLAMFDTYSDYDPIAPASGELLAELGLDVRQVRDTLADDLARRCPDREAPADTSWR